MGDLDLAELRDKCLNSLYSCTYNISKYEDTEQEEQCNKLRNYVKEYCLLESQEKISKQVLALVERESEDIEDIESLQARFQEEFNKRCSKTIKTDKHPYMIELEKYIKQAEKSRHPEGQPQGEDSDLAITEVQSAHLDPISQKRITNPVRNKICNHVYEKETIENFIKAKNKKCPYVGCSNRNPIKHQDLILDLELKQTLDSAAVCPPDENVSQISSISSEY